MQLRGEQPTWASCLIGGPRARRLFTHFFDIHLLAEKGGGHRDRIQQEMRLAFRFALLLADHVMVPASSYYESRMCRTVLDEYDSDDFAERISFVASGTNLGEFIESKISQYAADEEQGDIYRSADKSMAFPWHSRSRSSTRDISAAWTAGMERDGMERIASAVADQPADLARRLAEVPERLDRAAFIARNVSKIILGDARPTIQFTNRLLSTINDAYFGSYAQDLKAAVVQELIWLSSTQRVPSGDPDFDIDYRALREACRATGVLRELYSTAPHDLFRFRTDERFGLACLVARGEAQTIEKYRRITYSMPSSPPPKDDDGPSARIRTKVLVVTALPEELAAVLATCDEEQTLGVPGDYNIYRLCGIRIANGSVRRFIGVTASDMGKANAAALTVNALRSFPATEHVLMVGIAGGCPNPAKPDEHVRLGDIVVSDDHGIFEYDDVKLREGFVERRGAPQQPSAALLQAFNNLRAEAQLGRRPWEASIDAGLTKLVDAECSYSRPDAATDVLHDGASEIKHPADPRRRAGRPRVFGGAVATGDALVKDPKLRDELRDLYGARAIEMEGSAVRSATWSQGKDAIIIRGISDYCDGHKNNVWRFSAALAAAAYAKSLISILPEEWFY